MTARGVGMTSPRERVEAACARHGRDAVVAGCLALLDGGLDETLLRSLAGEGAEKFFDGREHDDTYWFRVWAMRGLLWAWDPSATGAVCRAFDDEAWRVREMAAKVAARHLVGAATDRLAALREDPVPRVRAAAERALVRITGAGA
jgi:hypothetical protein